MPHQVNTVRCRAMYSKRADSNSPLSQTNNGTTSAKQKNFAPSAFLGYTDTWTNADSHTIDIHWFAGNIGQDITRFQVLSKASLKQQILDGFKAQSNQ